jgi:hypothetical protein
MEGMYRPLADACSAAAMCAAATSLTSQTGKSKGQGASFPCRMAASRAAGGKGGRDGRREEGREGGQERKL